MVYFRKTRRRRRPRRGGRRQTLAQKVNAVVKRNIETKHIGDDVSESISTSVQAYSFSNLDSQGTTSSNFIGNEVRMQKLVFRAFLQQADSSNIVRFLVVNTRGLQSEANASDMFLPAATPLVAQLNNAYVKKVYMDRTYVLNNSGGDHLLYLNRTINLKNRTLHLQGVGDSAEQYWIVVVSDSSVITHPSILMRWETYFKDA